MIATAIPAQAASLTVDMLYVEFQRPIRPTLSNLVRPPADNGWQGARLGLRDSNTTGRFLKHTYRLKSIIARPDADPAKTIDQVLKAEHKFIIVNGDARRFKMLVAAASKHVRGRHKILMNAGSADDGLRKTICAPMVFHTLASRAMLTDALVQFLVRRRWKNMMLVEGRRAGDRKLAASMRRAVVKFGARLILEKRWLADFDIRRNAGREVPRFTQGADYDVLIAADEDKDFGQYLLYNTWLPRPVALSHGLRPVTWSRVVEQWGAAQLQRRFKRLSKRDMTGKDYAAWAAVRSISEAVTRLKSTEPDKIGAYLRSSAFSLAGFKGRKLSFRSWNGQLRQPIPLVHAGALVALAPIEGFLHRRTELDTLGFDKAETRCNR